MTEIIDAFYDEVDDPVLLTQVAEKLEANFMVFDPFISRCFGLEVWRLPIKTCKFRNNCRVKKMARGFEDV
jgi:hypothetical protein